VEQYFLNKQGFRRFAHQEILHLFKSALVKEAQTMVPKLRTRFVKSSPKVGIRAQLLNLSTRELVMDFLIEKGENSTHILNAVSPGWTSALSFAEFVVKDLL
jgi:L-2-hydroxyglutarate oxidase LhgO